MGTVQRNSQVPEKNEILKRQRLRQERTKALHSSGPYTDAFLKQVFSPVSALGRPEGEASSWFTSSFNKSLRYLSRTYNLNIGTFTDLPYPLNIRESFLTAKAAIDKRSDGTELILVSGHKKGPHLATAKVIDTGWTLYYLPLKPLWQLHLMKNKQTFCLLACMYAFLHQVARLPLFQQYNYLHDTCDMIRENMICDEGNYTEEEEKEFAAEFTLMDRVTPKLNDCIKTGKTLQNFSKMIEGFRPATSLEFDLLDIAKEFQQIQKEFPNRHFMENLSGELFYPDENERTYVEQYYSFCWTTKGWLMENVESYVNCDLQERSFLDEPCSVQHFDKPQINVDHSCTYHERLMASLNQLSETLNQI